MEEKIEIEKPKVKKSNTFKVVLITILITLFVIISIQNIRTVQLDVLIWKIDLPLVLLLTINTLSVAIITFILAKWKKK